MEEKYLIWHIQGGLGKNIAATALTKDIKKKYSDRKFILVCSYPSIFLNDPNIDKVYSIDNRPYFYENYIENKDSLLFQHEPYHQTGHITKQKHLIESWCELLFIEYKNQQPNLILNYAQSKLSLRWIREKPILLLQTTGGPAQPIPNVPPPPPNPYSWTRDIPIEVAQLIVNKYSSEYHIIQISKHDGYGLQGVERISQPLSNMELFSLLLASKKRILIDSALQHASVALNLPSIVFWIGTSPKLFGYDLHKNIVAKPPKRANQLINSSTFDYSFDYNTEECPYLNLDEMFDVKELIKELDTTDNFIKLHRQL